MTVGEVVGWGLGVNGNMVVSVGLLSAIGGIGKSRHKS